MLTSDIAEKIVCKSISLEEYGLNALAWSKKCAINLITLLKEDRIGILGRDVYKLTPNRLEPLYDNWSCKPINLETETKYFLRSKTESLNYIEKYPVDPKDNIIFSMTFTDQI